MNRPLFPLFCGLVSWLAVQIAIAIEPFVVEDIRIEGLQRISADTVFSYLPIEVGDEADDDRIADAIKALFRTGFFSDLDISRSGEALVISLVERPSIGRIEFSGNRTIETENLIAALENVGFVEGRVFDPSIFDRVEQEIRRAYFAQGLYSARIESTVTPLERNRVEVGFDISEGIAARIRQINIVGNASFDEDDLLDEFSSISGGFFSIIRSANLYSKSKLAADLEVLRSYYLDRGFVNFNIDSTQVSITPDKKDIYITINLSEGLRYIVRDINLQGDVGDIEEELRALIIVESGDIFSRKEVTESSRLIGERFGNDGYLFANVNAVPILDDETGAVDLDFYIDSGKRVYVRRINFSGNAKTRDEVLRREMRQLEGSWVSTSAIRRSKERVERLDFFDSVEVETVPVPETDDQVDIDFTVSEKSSGNILLGAGFSQSEGAVLSSSITERNFLGTGSRVKFSFDNSEVNRDISLSWLNPYWTIDGISRGFDAYNRRTDASAANLTDYNLDDIGAALNFGIPVSEFTDIRLGLEVKQTDFILGTSPSEEIIRFNQQNGPDFITLLASTSWSRDGRNSWILPTTGSLSRLRAEIALPGGDLTYYKISAQHQHLFPIPGSFVLMIEGEVGYGEGYGDLTSLPLTDNFFVGGLRSVRGFTANTLGPRDSKGDPLGGSLKTVGSAELVIPIPFVEDAGALRVASFFDIGNVYGPDEDFDADMLRYSTGLSALWLSPIGPFTLSLAAPVGEKPDDDTQSFQFTFGTSF
ncbi:MAG: outer membrane protein assembly factor BamA [Ectothiorhodospiraceae bacterium AqS1]|nr:outer membrane protein assembly factor BamA [Ectothiorhodospiraceae bacterium AqS1]